MNIMYILHESGNSFNGASRSALTLIRAAALSGDKVYVVLPEKKGKIVDELLSIQNVEILEAQYFRWSQRRTSRYLSNIYRHIKYRFYEDIITKKTARRLSQFSLEHNVDVIHTNSKVINLGGYIHKFSKIPHVWHVREFGEEDFDMYPMESKKSFYKFMYDNSDAIVCISEAIAKKLSINMPQEKIRIIYNGVDVPPLNNTYNLSNNLLITGVISVKKGQWIAVKATELLKERGIEVNLFIAGKGDERTLNITENISGNINLLGFVDNMNNVRKMMGLELMCSVSEGFGRTTVEAMAAGIPIVAANGGATPEIIKDRDNGFLFNVNDPNSLADVLEKIFSCSEKEISDIRVAAYEDVKIRFSKERYINDVRLLYNEIVNK